MSMSLVGTVVLVLSVVCFVKCDTSVKLTAPSKHADHPNKCWDEGTKTAYTVGSHTPKESCQRIHCYPDFRIKYTSCGTHSAGEGHSIEQDLTKVYPECCAKLVKNEKKGKRVDVMESNAVKIVKFQSKPKSVDVLKEKKPLEQKSSGVKLLEPKPVGQKSLERKPLEQTKPLKQTMPLEPSTEEKKPSEEVKTLEKQQPKEESTE